MLFLACTATQSRRNKKRLCENHEKTKQNKTKNKKTKKQNKKKTIQWIKSRNCDVIGD